MYGRFWKNVGQGVGILALFALVGLPIVRLTAPLFPVVAGVTQHLPLTSDIVDFSLSPDSAKILYGRNVPDSGAQAYLLTRPERNR